MENRDKELFPFGTAVGVHGLRGDLKIRPFTAGSTALEDATAVFFRRKDSSVAEFVPVRVSPHKGQVLLRLQGHESLEAVEGLVGCEVLMRLEELTELPEAEFYWFELQGMTVVDATRGELGRLEEIFTTAAHDIYVVRGPYGEVLIPAVDEFVRDVDRQQGRMVVELPEGLVRNTE